VNALNAQKTIAAKRHFKLIGFPGLVADAEDTAYGSLQQSGRQLRTRNFSIKLGSTHSSPQYQRHPPSMRLVGRLPSGDSMSSSMLVYEPVAPCLTELRESRQSLDSLAGKVIGFIDNSKPNFNLLVDDLAQILIEKHGVKSVVKRRKKSASQGAPAEVMNELVGQVDAVITGSGD